jgi:hypothetical protein
MSDAWAYSRDLDAIISASHITVTETEPGYPPNERDADHVAATGHHHNGLPEVKPYRWRPGDAERDAEIAERLAIIRARLRMNTDGERHD